MTVKRNARVAWVDGLRFVGEAGSGHAIVVDAQHGAEDGSTGPSPMELLLLGLAGCTAADVVHMLKRRRQSVTGVRVEVEGERAEEHPRIYTSITLHYRITGQELSEKAVVDSIELSQEKYCSASAMLKKTAQMSYSYEIFEEKNVRTAD